MVLLTVPFDPNREGRVQPISRAGALVLLSCFIGVGVGLLIEYSGSPTHSLGRGLAGGAAHGALLVGGWMIAGRQLVCLLPVVQSAVVLCLASVMTMFSAWCAVLYLAPPVILLLQG